MSSDLKRNAPASNLLLRLATCSSCLESSRLKKICFDATETTTTVDKVVARKTRELRHGTECSRPLLAVTSCSLLLLLENFTFRVKTVLTQLKPILPSDNVLCCETREFRSWTGCSCPRGEFTARNLHLLFGMLAFRKGLF